MKNYWESRSVGKSPSLASIVKRSRLTQSIAGALLSLRAADEAFLARALRRRKVRSVLDLACGSGKAVLPSVADYTAGVDIVGFPAEEALAKGYDEVREYEAPDYAFDLGRTVDAVTAINLNAHIPSEAYGRILGQGLRFLRPGGTLILIHEYDNHGASYRWMRRDDKKFRRFVEGMEHWHLDFEEQFLEQARGRLPGMKLVERRPLTAAILPSIHYYAYAAQKDPGPWLRKLFLATDVPLSLANSIQCRLTDAFNRSFLVGYVFEAQQ
jgi:SAM-dependent methyltransferase